MPDSPVRVATSATQRPRWHVLVVDASFFAATLAIAGATWLFYARHWATSAAFVAAIDNSCPLFACDFARHYYPMGQVAYQAQAPVFGYYYSQTFGFFLHAFALLPLATAVRAWTALQVSATLVLLLVSYAAFAARSRVAYLACAVLLCTGTPLLHDLRWGQVGTLKCALVLLAWLCYRERLGGMAALLLACATVMKYEVGIFAVVFAMRRDYDLVLLYGALLGLLLLVVPAHVLGSWGAMFEFQAASARALESVPSWAAANPNSQFFSAVVARAPVSVLRRLPWLNAHARGLGYALACGNVLVAWAMTRAAVKDALTWAFCLVFLCTPFLVATAWTHYFVHMAFVQVFLLLAVLDAPGEWPSRVAKLALLWLPSVVLPSSLWFLHQGDWQRYVTVGPLCYANLCLLVLAHVQALPLLVAARRRRASKFDLAAQR